MSWTPIVLVTIYMFAASIVVGALDLRAAQREDDDVYLSFMPITGIWACASISQWTTLLVLLYLDWRVAVGLFLLRTILSTLPVLGFIGHILLLPCYIYIRRRERAISAAELAGYDDGIDVDDLIRLIDERERKVGI